MLSRFLDLSFLQYCVRKWAVTWLPTSLATTTHTIKHLFCYGRLKSCSCCSRQTSFQLVGHFNFVRIIVSCSLLTDHQYASSSWRVNTLLFYVFAIPFGCIVDKPTPSFSLCTKRCLIRTFTLSVDLDHFRQCRVALMAPCRYGTILRWRHSFGHPRLQLWQLILSNILLVATDDNFAHFRHILHWWSTCIFPG